MRFGWLALALFCPTTAFAQQTTWGFQLGLSQSAGTTIGDVQVLAADPVVPLPGEEIPPQPVEQQQVDQAQTVVAQSQGLQLTTNVNGNLTLDIATRTLNHAFALGVGAAQLIPTLLPRDETGEVEQNVVANQTTTFQANLNYLSVIQRPTWSFSLGAGYGFALNGLIPTAADGSRQGTQIANAANNIPGQQVGAFSFNGRTHSANGSLILQLTPGLTWDLSLNANYGYTQNGIFTLAAGPLGGQAQAGATTNLGVFVPATIHTFSPSLSFRTRAGRRGQINTNALVTYTRPQEIDDSVTITGTTTEVFRAAQPPPTTLLNSLTLQYAYNMNDSRAFGAELQGSINYRVPTDPQGIVLANSTLDPDTLIYQARVFYTDVWPGEIRATLGVGAAQAWLFQPPLGAQNDADTFEAVRSNPEPIFDASLQRRFEPVDISIFAQRTVGVGALGVSAIVNESANVVFGWLGEFGEFRPQAAVGFNVNRVRGVGRDQFPPANPNDPIALAFNNEGFGTNVNVAIPLFEAAGFALDMTASYAFNWVNGENVPPLATHTVFGVLRAVYGRGSAQAAAGAGGRTLQDELDAFTADPANGSPLLSNQLMQQGDPLQLGRRIGQAPEQRRDSRQVYQQTIQQQARDQADRDRSGVVQSVGTSDEEAKRAAEEELRRREEEEQKPKAPPPSWPDALNEAPPPPEPAPQQ